MIELRIGRTDVVMIEVVKGLVSEGDAVRDAMADLSPDAVALSLHREGVRAIRHIDDCEEYVPSDVEIAYSELMSRFGDVEMPSPCYVAAIDEADRLRIDVIPLDMPETVFSENYCDLVGVRDMIAEGRRLKKAAKRRFDVSSPTALARGWEAWMDSSPGFRRLRGRRVDHMWGSLHSRVDGHRKVLAIVESGFFEPLAQYSTP